MRWLIVLGLAASCQRGDEVEPRTPAPAPSITARAITLAPEPLAWSLAEDVALERLKAAGMAPRSEAQHGWEDPDRGFA